MTNEEVSILNEWKESVRQKPGILNYIVEPLCVLFVFYFVCKCFMYWVF